MKPVALESDYWEHALTYMPRMRLCNNSTVWRA